MITNPGEPPLPRRGQDQQSVNIRFRNFTPAQFFNGLLQDEFPIGFQGFQALSLLTRQNTPELINENFDL
jgi:hypothetical protein